MLSSKPSDLIETRRFNIACQKISWAVRMHGEFDSCIVDYGRQASKMLTVRFMSWPETGTLEVKRPATWWDHLKQSLRARFPRLLRRLTVSEHTTIYRATAVLPAIDLPKDLKEGMFAVFSRSHWSDPE